MNRTNICFEVHELLGSPSVAGIHPILKSDWLEPLQDYPTTSVALVLFWEDDCREYVQKMEIALNPLWVKEVVSKLREYQEYERVASTRSTEETPKEVEEIHEKVKSLLSKNPLERGRSSTITPSEGWLIKQGMGTLLSFHDIQREVYALRALAHTGVVPHLHPNWEEEGEVTLDEFQMELIPNTVTLGDYIRAAEHGDISEDNLLPLLELAVQAVRAAAEEGFFHADSHPDNFLVGVKGGEWTLHLIDWGRVFVSSDRLSEIWTPLQEEAVAEWGGAEPTDVKSACGLAAHYIKYTFIHGYWEPAQVKKWEAIVDSIFTPADTLVEEATEEPAAATKYVPSVVAFKEMTTSPKEVVPALRNYLLEASLLVGGLLSRLSVYPRRKK